MSRAKARQASAETTDTQTRLRASIAAAQDRKAEDLRVLELSEASDFTDYFLICSGNSERQVQAIAEAINERLRELGERPLHLEGMTQGQWVLMDYADLVVHVFEAQKRDFYRLERLWGDAPDRTDDFVAPDGEPSA